MRLTRSLVPMLASCLSMLPAQEGDRDARRERLRALEQQVERLQAAGQHEEANAVAQRLRDLQSRMHEAAGSERRARPGDDLRDILNGLEQGMRALRALDRRQELEAVERVAVEARQRLAGIERDAQARRGDAGGDADRERQVARETIEVMHIAKGAILRAGRNEAAELVERAIAAREVNLQGRRDEEANTIRSNSPDHAAQTELLGWGVRLLREQGRPDEAERVGRVAEQFLERHRRQQENRAKDASPDRPREEARAERRGGDGGGAAELTQRLQQMERALQAMQQQLEELRRQRIR